MPSLSDKTGIENDDIECHTMPYLYTLESDDERGIISAQKRLEVELKHGDCVNYDKYRFGDARFVVVEDGKKRFVENPDNSGSGYLEVPAVVSKRFSDVLKAYSNFPKDLHEIQIANIRDVNVKHIFNNGNTYPNAKFSYVADFDRGGWLLNVKYKSLHESFELKTVTNADIDAFIELQTISNPFKRNVSSCFKSLFRKSI
jgi:hypothetical protein